MIIVLLLFRDRVRKEKFLHKSTGISLCRRNRYPDHQGQTACRDMQWRKNLVAKCAAFLSDSVVAVRFNFLLREFIQ